MAKADYTYAVARIRSMELKLFSAKEIDNLLDNSDKYDKMRESSKKLGVLDSATRIYEEIRKLIG